VVKEVNTKDDIFGFKGGYPVRIAQSPMWGYTMHDRKASKKIDTQKNGMTSFLVSGQRNQGLK
jgi:hypothetical protein